MIRVLLIAFVLLITDDIKAQKLDLNAVRNDFNKGVKDEKLCKRYLDLLDDQADTPVERGYAAAFHMFMAKHTSNPFKKMGFFKDGRDRLEKELKSNPNNVELRFIRLSIQYHIPKYLGYHDAIKGDKDYLKNNLHKLDDKFTKEKIYKYLKGANMYTTEELALLGR
ncbi:MULTISPECIES: hypothetical protein [Sphingobacterium]|uniref:Uncharacterized protein n=1 Tax=Sphingobacterium tenebrionis TaxID=3111775 RepID=A0ABU8I2K3_9SPHI|nr:MULTISPECIES: hypothetical protein [unclassified Sphingobacterium]QBR11720.1 hypothetical protein E3D81_05845 [Sphingobacterium sp. CZ-2]